MTQINKKSYTASLCLATILLTLSLLCESLDAECLQLIDDYYNCMEGDLTTSNRNDPNVSRLPDSFFRTKLSPYGSFATAMDLFKNIYQELQTCTTDKCACVKTESYLRYDYETMFTSSLLYPQVFSILNTIKTSYRLLPQSRIFNYNIFFNPNYPTLNSFCLNFEYGSTVSFFYNQTFNCYSRYLTNEKYFHDCRSSYLTLDIYNRNQTLDIFSRAKLELYFGCVSTLFQPCETSVRRAVIMGFLVESTNVINGASNLVSYIDYLSSLNVRPTLERYEISFNGANFVTLNNESITCDLQPNKNYTYFASPQLKIFGNF